MKLTLKKLNQFNLYIQLKKSFFNILQINFFKFLINYKNVNINFAKKKYIEN